MTSNGVGNSQKTKKEVKKRRNNNKKTKKAQKTHIQLINAYKRFYMGWLGFPKYQWRGLGLLIILTSLFVMIFQRDFQTAFIIAMFGFFIAFFNG